MFPKSCRRIAPLSLASPPSTVRVGRSVEGAIIDGLITEIDAPAAAL
jgi:hypothetical protein